MTIDLKEQALNKEYPDNWKTLGSLMGLEVTCAETTGNYVFIENKSGDVLTIDKYNTVSTDGLVVSDETVVLLLQALGLNDK